MEFNGDVHFFCFWLEIPFRGKFSPKSQNYQLKLKFGTYTNSNMQNSMMLFTFVEWKRLFWANLVQKIKIVTLSWNLVPTLIRIYRIQWWCLFFFVFDRKYLFGVNLVQKIKILVLSWNLVPTLIWTRRIQW